MKMWNLNKQVYNVLGILYIYNKDVSSFTLVDTL